MVQAAALLARLETPTGLAPAEIRALRRGEKVQLAAWHEMVAGDDNGRPWWPAAIRLLPLDGRLALAADDAYHALFVERERRRCLEVGYFTRSYGHVRHESDDDEPGPPVPFTLWTHKAPGAIGVESQADVLRIFTEYRRIVALKARQLGLTWLALHYALHLMAIDERGSNAVVLGLSQDGGYAKRLLERAREINQLLPLYLRHREDAETKGSKSEFKLWQRGRMVSLAGTPDAPRSWQADLAICDEWGFVRNGNAGPTMRALLSMARQIIAISSGNGPPEEQGWGQHFAQLYVRAASGENGWTPVFLPDSTNPARTAEWRAAKRDEFDTDEDFAQEHPETPDQALIGTGKDRFFSITEMNEIVRRGAELDALLGTDDMPPPAGELLHGGIDWGENGFAVPGWPLEAGGLYVPPGETVGHGVEPGEQTIAFHRNIAELQEVNPQTGQLEPLIGEQRYDAAGRQSMRTFLATARSRFAAQYANGEVRSRKVPFGEFKTETAKYLKRLARRTGQKRTTGILAISPANEQLIRQMRALESGPGGVWKKALDQDGPDALIALAQRIARRHRELQGDGDER